MEFVCGSVWSKAQKGICRFTIRVTADGNGNDLRDNDLRDSKKEFVKVRVK